MRSRLHPVPATATGGGGAAGARVASRPPLVWEPVLTRDALGPPTTLADIREWTKSGPTSWDRSETRDGALSGADGEISHTLPDAAWEFHGLLTLANGDDAKTDSAMASVLGADGTRFAVLVRNLGSTFLVMVQTIDATGAATTHRTVAVAPRTLDVVFSRTSPHALQIAVDGVPLEHALVIAPAAAPPRAVTLRVTGSTQVGHGRLEVADVALRSAAFPTPP